MDPLNNCILVVDDDWGILEAFEAIFEDERPVLLVDNGKDALEVIRNNKPHLLFLDIKMPGMNGMDVLQWISSNGLDLDVVVITALPQDHYEQLARQYGVRAYLRKPFDLHAIESIAGRLTH